MMASRWSEEDVALLDLMYQDLTKTPEDLEEIFNRKFHCIVAKAGYLGIKRPRPKSYVVDSHYFDVIDSPEKAYWLGFFVADGGLVKRTMIQFNLSIRDQDILRWLADQVAPEAEVKPLKDRPDVVTLQISDGVLSDRLRSMGYGPGKCRALTWPNELPSSLNIPFIMGCFDGDGSLIFDKRDHLWTWELSASEHFLFTVRDIIHNEIGVQLTNPTKHSQTKHLYRLRTSGSFAVTIIHAFSRYDIGLKRKRIATNPDNIDY